MIPGIPHACKLRKEAGAFLPQHMDLSNQIRLRYRLFARWFAQGGQTVHFELSGR